MKLRTQRVEKPWGRTEIPAVFGDTGGRRIGEVWFEGPDEAELPLLAKYIFTSERLSIQVHPSHEQARKRGHRQGKNECWYILDAEEGASLGLGLIREVGGEELRAAALDGSIVDLIDWKPVQAGDFFYVPAGTVHAIGGGVSLLELQQNVDITYRLYDYGRPRQLHLDDGIKVARSGPYRDGLAQRGGRASSKVLLRGPDFTLLRLEGLTDEAERLAGRQRWVMPLKGSASSAGESAAPGECLLLEPGAPFALSDGAVILLGAPGRL